MVDGFVASMAAGAPPGHPPLTSLDMARCICSPGLDASVFTGVFSPAMMPTLCGADCRAYMQLSLSMSTSADPDDPPPHFFGCLCDVPAIAAFTNGAPDATTSYACSWAVRPRPASQ